MKTMLMNKEELRQKSNERKAKDLYHRVWDEIMLTKNGDDVESGTIHSINKLYDPDNDSIRISFSYHIGGNFHTEYLESQDDICDVKELLELGANTYKNVVSKLRFVAQPCWND